MGSRGRGGVAGGLGGRARDLGACQVLAVGPIVDQNLADPQGADRRIDHAQAGGAGLALHVGQAVAAGREADIAADADSYISVRIVLKNNKVNDGSEL